MTLAIHGDRVNDLATKGVAQSVFYRGQIGERRVYDSRLLFAALRHHGLRPAGWSLKDGV